VTDECDLWNKKISVSSVFFGEFRVLFDTAGGDSFGIEQDRRVLGRA
jgi:hypothetical protein